MKLWCGHEEENTRYHENDYHESEVVNTPNGVFEREVCMVTKKYRLIKYEEV